MRRGASSLRSMAALSLAVLLAAHVGSPDIFFSGKAGPYDVDIVVRPPTVVPGIADVYVQSADPRVTRVVVVPVYWNAGTAGAPAGDEATKVAGTRGGFSGTLWMMRNGSYSVNVVLSGTAGSGTAIVPVGAVATGQLALGNSLKWLLAALGTLLAVGMVTAVHAAVGESLVPVGESMSPARRRRARLAAALALPVVAFIGLGGANWWQAEAAAYRRTLYKPVPTRSAVSTLSGVASLTLTVTDPAWAKGGVTPIMPDHGKMAHMFIVHADSLDVLVHAHPAMPDRTSFVTPLPALPAGRYRVYADVVHESGYERTLVDSFALTTALDAAGATTLPPDDAVYVGGATAVRGPGSERALGDGLVATWAGAAQPVVGAMGAVRFGLRDATGGPVQVEPYLGMHGHAVVMRRDGGVFIHLHPSGTSSMASQAAFALRNRGDTTADGRLRLANAPMDMSAAAPLREIAFPYAFPSAGDYRVWLQLRSRGSVHTAAFDVTVRAAAH